MVDDQTFKELLEEARRAEHNALEARERMLQAHEEYSRLSSYLTSLKAVIDFRSGATNEQTASSANGLLPPDAAPIRDRVLAIFEAEKRPLEPNYIDQALRLKGCRYGQNSVWMALKRLERRGVVKKVRRGLYSLTNGGSAV